jgi:hypothetical protein
MAIPATKHIDLPFETLSPAAKEVADQARTTMEKWIDDKIQEVRADVESRLADAVTGVAQEFENVQREISERRTQIEDLLEGVVRLQKDMDFGDGQNLVEAAANTQKIMEAVRTELAAYERRWTSVGAGVVNKITTVVKGVL